MPFDSIDTRLQVDEPPRPQDQPADIIISSDTRRGDGAEKDRIPPKQSRTKKWPVLDTGYHPNPKDLTPEVWRFDLFGLIEDDLSFTWDEFQSLPRTRVFADMHCVTRW